MGGGAQPASYHLAEGADVDLHLSGKVALITGAGGGIGRETALLLAREGARLAAADVRLAAAEETAQAVRAAGGQAHAFALDVTSAESVERAAGEAEAQAGPIDVLVNCAGIYRVGDYSAVDPDEWRQVLDVNLTGTYLMCRAVLPRMIERGRGSIVNLSSISGVVGQAFVHMSYNASKGAVRTMTKSTAVQFGKDRIRCNSVHPGLMPPMRTSGATADPEVRARMLKAVPLGRAGEVDEVANAVLFLASDEASYITGAELYVDGGFLAM
jgi:NAD(P)-dependent dehydrogenase (short-subunit alcohol dehydrogenase family)